MHFKDLGLDARLLNKLNHLAFDRATEIQQTAVPVAIAGKDILASSKTGSGKTLAFLLPAMQRMYRGKPFTRRDPRVLILTPTRELAKQIFAQLRTLNAGTPYDATLIVGGENFNDQVKALRNDPMFVVATPGRFADHLEHRSTHLDGLEMLILDEADRMLDLGFEPQLRRINEAANHRRRQTLMFSATMDHVDVMSIASEMLDMPKRISIGHSAEEHTDITQRFILCDHLDHKQALLDKVLEVEDYNQVIIFTATRADTDRLTAELNERKLKAVALSGNLSQTQRNSIMSQFERNCHKILVTTDIASRGLDIDSVSLVINFDMPRTAEVYLHRIGRTARAGKKGTAIALVEAHDQSMMERISRYMQEEVQERFIHGLRPKTKKSNTAKKKKKVDKKVKEAKAKKKIKQAAKKSQAKS